MAKSNSPAKLRLINTQDWEASEVPKAAARRGTAAVAVDPALAQLLATGKVELAHTLQVAQPRARRGQPPQPIRLEAAAKETERHVLMVRHASGAISFHIPAETERRGVTRTVRFQVPIRPTIPEAQEKTLRGLVPKVVQTFLLKVGGKIAEKAIPNLASIAESLIWSKGLKLAEGWKGVTSDALSAGKLPNADLSRLSTSKPNLLLIHGTFSHAAAAFPGLAAVTGSNGQTFLSAAQTIYENRIFAFDHFTVSKSTTQNALELLKALPTGPFTFDVVTHSRGGLVLRTLTELAASLGGLAGRFQLRRAVLVASPNDGTPLASPARFNLFLNWMMTVLSIAEAIPVVGTSPMVTAANLIAEGLSWLANHVLPALPGLEAMDSGGDLVHRLAQSTSAAPSAYSALVSNFQADAKMLQRIADAGIDGFFGTANDLVVPTEGGWDVHAAAAPLIPADRIGCFGPGGNLQKQIQIWHITFFSQPETIDFLHHALTAEAQGLAPLNPATHLPFGLRRAALAMAAAAAAPLPTAPPQVAPPALQPADRATAETFYLTILSPDPVKKCATLVASFRNATVVQEVPLAGGDAGKRFHEIISLNRNIRSYVNGEAGVQEPPQGEDLIRVGKQMFDTLFPGDVHRLYDVARAEQRTGRINVIFTSAVGWVADLPYEFVFDPVRNTFLATSEINFTRNVVTAVPAALRRDLGTALRILVIVAQPVGLAHLSADTEAEAIRSGYERLIRENLATVDVLLDATPARVHELLEVSAPFDIVHFIGHGDYDPKTDRASLVFQDEDGRQQMVGIEEARPIFCRRGIQLMFLNACETAKGGKADFNRGMAQSLVADGIPTVVANQYSVLDVSATSFAQHFYWSLAHGSTIGDAAREARIAVNCSISGENLDWAVPVVFARDPAARLVERRTQPDLVSSMSRTARREVRRGLARQEKWGLWDVQGIIPNLGAIAEKLTECQSTVHFQQVRLSAPIGTWRREKGDHGTQAYLHAVKVAKRLQNKPRELGVNRLIAITNLPLRDDDYLNLYAWDEDPEGAIAIVSMEPYLDQLSSSDVFLKRFIANAVSGILSTLPAHNPGERAGRFRAARDCPMYFNAELSVDFAAGPLKICPLCKHRLEKKKMSGLLPVMQAIMAAYSV